LSYVIQKARCRSCGAALSSQYPLVELGTGAAFAVTLGYFGFPADYLNISVFQYLGLAAALIAVSAGIVILVADLRWQIIPNGAGLALLIALIGRVLPVDPSLAWINWAADLISALIAALFFVSLWFFSGGRWMGLGDAKLVFTTSLLVGFPASMAAILFAFWFGGIAGILLLAVGSKTLKSRIPFGPFILAGAALAFFLADRFLAFTGLGLLL
jgi:prepilin signal peptidase PulO-like enzyme (type II secretory pathway)